MQLETQLGRLETCVSKLTGQQLWTRYGENQNAVGNLVLHLTGNVRQWILSGIGGAPGRARVTPSSRPEDPFRPKN